jgi:hypothetical protein
MDKKMKLISNIVPLSIFIVGAVIAIAVCVSRRDTSLRASQYGDEDKISIDAALYRNEVRVNPPIIDDTITTGEAAISSRLDALDDHIWAIRYISNTIEWTLCAWFSLWCVQQIALYVRLQFSFQVRK